MMTNCDFCNKKIKINLYRFNSSKKHFCSRECFANWMKEHYKGKNNPRWNSIKKICKNCGKEIFVKKSKIDKQLFCNETCFFEWLRKNPRLGKDNPNWRSIEGTCDYCGKKIYITPKQLKTSKNHFCNKHCFDEWSRKYKPRGKDSPVWNKISKKCKNCGKTVLTNPSKLKLVNNIFCSKECYNDWQRKNAPRGKNSLRWKQRLLTCDFCKKQFYRAPAFIINKHNFCCRECFIKWKQNNVPKGKDSPSWNRVKTQCAYCKKEIYVISSSIGTRKNHFCDRTCMANWKKEHALRGKDHPYFNSEKTQCAYCKKEILLKQYRLKKFKHNFCCRDCHTKWIRNNRPRGKNSPYWTGGKFRYYGINWIPQKTKILKRANNASEISGNEGVLLDIHHIIPLKNFIQKYIDLCLIHIMPIERHSFRILPYDLIPELIFEEANRKTNLICVTRNEHTKFEGMPIGFFEAVLNFNSE